MDKNKNKAEKAEKNSQTKDNAPEIVDDLEEVVDSPDAEPDVLCQHRPPHPLKAGGRAGE